MLTNTVLSDLSVKQQSLDQFIEQNLTSETKASLFEKRIVAFLVELGEYANEERAFKFWSQKEPSELDVRLEEYIDGLHFLLSLGNSINFDFNQFKPNNNLTANLNPVDNYFVIINALNNFISDANNNTYTNLLTSFLNIMTLQNYHQDEVLKVYDQKNAINYNRQKHGY